MTNICLMISLYLWLHIFCCILKKKKKPLYKKLRNEKLTFLELGMKMNSMQNLKIETIYAKQNLKFVAPPSWLNNIHID